MKVKFLMLPNDTIRVRSLPISASKHILPRIWIKISKYEASELVRQKRACYWYSTL